MAWGIRHWLWVSFVLYLAIGVPSQSQHLSAQLPSEGAPETLSELPSPASLDLDDPEDMALPEPLQLASGQGSSGADPKAAKKAPKKIELTGVWRLRYEAKENFDLIYDRPSVDPGVADNDDDFLLSRLRLFLDLRPNEYIQAHFTFQDAREFGSDLINHDQLDRSSRNTFKNQMDIYEGYLKLKLGECPLWLQLGRQELVYGDSRLLGNNMWGNTGRSYDAARLLYEKEDVKIDLFVGNRVLVDSNAWDEPDHHDNLMGAYATIKNLPQGLQDIYLIYRDNNPAMLEEYTLGTRIVGDEGPVDWNFEGVYQWGTATDKVVPNRKGEVLDQEAWAAHAELGYTWKTQPLKPRLGVEYNFASGDDDPLDSSNNTFDQLFPTNHVPWGIMDFIGWKNMHSIGSRLSWAQTRNLKITTEWHAFWLDEEQNDAWYDSTGRVFRNAAGKDVSSFLGHEFNLFATYKVSEKLEMEAGYGHYFAGQYAADTAPIGAGSDDADFVYLMTTYKF